MCVFQAVVTPTLMTPFLLFSSPSLFLSSLDLSDQSSSCLLFGRMIISAFSSDPVFSIKCAPPSRCTELFFLRVRFFLTMVDDLSSTELKVQPDGPCQHLDLYQKTCVRTNATGQMLQLNSHIRQKYNG